MIELKFHHCSSSDPQIWGVNYLTWWRRRLQNKAECTERDRRRRKDAGEGIPEPPKLRTAAALSVAAWWAVQLIMLISVIIPAAIPRPQSPGFVAALKHRRSANLTRPPRTVQTQDRVSFSAGYLSSRRQKRAILGNGNVADASSKRPINDSGSSIFWNLPRRHVI